jgi:hypothetical protein
MLTVKDRPLMLSVVVLKVDMLSVLAPAHSA